VLELITVYNLQEEFYLSKILINPAHISIVKDCDQYNALLREGKIDVGFDQEVRFSEITMSGQGGFQNYIVVGSATQIQEKLNRNNIQLLRD
tara:strand:+ start:129 stop:404 length:276 start_codon:yes stop_codon:yes gene_type:complete